LQDKQLESFSRFDCCVSRTENYYDYRFDNTLKSKQKKNK